MLEYLTKIHSCGKGIQSTVEDHATNRKPSFIQDDAEKYE